MITLQRDFSHFPSEALMATADIPSRGILDRPSGGHTIMFNCPSEGIRQDFPLEGNIYKFYNPFERLTVFFFCHLGILLPIFHTLLKNRHCRGIS